MAYVSRVMNFRRENPAMWRGRSEFNRYRDGEAEILIVTKTDDETGNRVDMVFSDRDTQVTLAGEDSPRDVKAYVPLLIRRQ